MRKIHLRELRYWIYYSILLWERIFKILLKIFIYSNIADDVGIITLFDVYISKNCISISSSNHLKYKKIIMGLISLFSSNESFQELWRFMNKKIMMCSFIILIISNVVCKSSLVEEKKGSRSKPWILNCYNIRKLIRSKWL